MQIDIKLCLFKLSIRFLQKRKVAYFVSASLLLISLYSLSTNGLNQGVDFVGGRTYTVRFDNDVNQSEIANTFKKYNLKTIIHGHTHRPFIHKDENLVRVVLSDWENEVNYATVIDGEISLETF